ncbi:unnamed protein product [Protopolystoma xenopodis]|uniref:Uncharacterized protein n=1 Tax=Protopolystoma xenopodis TaxID=117903 RepID=A0A448WQM8_9PLAT|nr:unnamed protein product [Protopolystoma xenopodis]
MSYLSKKHARFNKKKKGFARKFEGWAYLAVETIAFSVNEVCHVCRNSDKHSSIQVASLFSRHHIELWQQVQMIRLWWLPTARMAAKWGRSGSIRPNCIAVAKEDEEKESTPHDT